MNEQFGQYERYLYLRRVLAHGTWQSWQSWQSLLFGWTTLAMQHWLVIISDKAICWSNHCQAQLGNSFSESKSNSSIWSLVIFKHDLYTWSSHDLYTWLLHIPEQPRTHSEPPWVRQLRHVVVDFSIFKFISTVQLNNCTSYKYIRYI